MLNEKATTKTSSNRVFADGEIFYVLGEFDNEMRDGLIWSLTHKIQDLATKRDATITVYIDSNGGQAYLCIHLVMLFELAKKKGIIVKTIVPSHAFSCGSLLAIAGTKGERYIGRDAEHLVHHGTFDGHYKTTSLQLDRHTEHWKRWTKALIRHYQTYAAIPDLEAHLKDDDFYIPADKAIKWGLADKYVEDME